MNKTRTYAGKSLFLFISGFMLFGLLAVSTHADEALDFEIIKTHEGEVFSISATDIDQDGNVDVIYAPYVGADIGMRIMYGKGNLEFEEPVIYPVDMRTSAIAFINTDSRPDVVTSHLYHLQILLNNGDRTFTIDSIPQGHTNCAGVAVGYFNNDSYADIITGYDILLLGNGTGQFPFTKTLPFFGQTVYVSDFNNDGLDDILALAMNGNGGIYLNDGKCNFSQSCSFDLGGFTMAVSIANPFADFNHDGNADFAFVTPIEYGKYSHITIGYGDGAGGIIYMDTLLSSGTAHSLAIADINRDHNLDLIASDATNKMLVMFTGDGGGNFSDSMQVDIGTDSISHAMATADMDRDGNPDFACGTLSLDTISLAINLLPDVDVLDDIMATTGYSTVRLDIRNPEDFRISKNYRTVAGSEYYRLDVDNDGTLDEQAMDYNLHYGEYKIIIKTRPDAPSGTVFSAGTDIGGTSLTFFKDYSVPRVTRAKDGSDISDSIIFYYTVEPFSSIQPPNGRMATEQPTFDWSGLVEDLPPNTIYHFQLDRYYDFRSPLYDVDNLATSEFTPDTPLEIDSLYYWRFRSFDGGQWSDYSRTFAVSIVDHICGDIDGNDTIDLLDILCLVGYLYKSGPAPDIPGAGDVNGDGSKDMLDILHLIAYSYKSGPEPVCP
jgi:hypothetical protein